MPLYNPSSSSSSSVANMTYESRSSNTILGTADKGKTIDLTASFTQTFTAAATLGAGWWVILRAKKTGTSQFYVTLDPNGSETIDGYTTQRLSAGSEILVTCDGSNFNVQTLAGTYRPEDIDSLVLWLDAEDASTITSSGGSVSSWADKSGYGHDVTEATNKPVTGTRTINGRNTLDFNGSNQQLRRTSTLVLAPYAGYVVVEPDSVTGVHVIARTQGSGLSLYLNGADGNTAMASSGHATITSAASVGTPLMISVRNIGATYSRGRAAGADSTAVLADGANVLLATEIDIGVNTGGGAFFDGKIAEVIFLGSPSDLDTDYALRNWLANKWNVTA